MMLEDLERHWQCITVAIGESMQSPPSATVGLGMRAAKDCAQCTAGTRVIGVGLGNQVIEGYTAGIGEC
jgi:hypothetical protein